VTQAQLNGIQVFYNTAQGDGGGIEFTGQTLVVFDRGIVQGNFAAGAGGGIDASVLADNGSPPSFVLVEGTNIINNRAGVDGGGVNFFSSVGGVLGMRFDLIQLNVAGGDGGGIASNAAVNTFQYDVVSLNFSSGNGGGIDFLANPIGRTQASSVQQSYLANNIAGKDGGGILAATNANSYLQVVNDTFVGNTAHDHGGALANEGNTQTDVLFSTINANMAHQGGGIFNDATGFRGAIVFIAVGLGNDIIAGNSADPSNAGQPPINTGANGYAIYGVFSDSLYTPAIQIGPNGPAQANVVGHNYIDALGPLGSYTPAYPGDLSPTNHDNVSVFPNFNLNPPSNFLGSPSYNGGPLQPPGFWTEVPLVPTLNNSGPSPVIDEGIINGVVQAFFGGPGGTVVDQTNKARDTVPDIGAFETFVPQA
jgi:hypothetical protein